MPFYPPSWLPKLPFDPPDTVSIPEFMLDEKWGRCPIKHSRDPYTCGLSGRSHSAAQLKQRVNYLARGLAKELGWKANEGSEWDKVAGIFSLNTIDSLTVSWATHTLGGVVTPANAAYNASELEHQLHDSKAKCVFTCLPLLDVTLEVAEKVGISRNKVYILELPLEATDGRTTPAEFKTVDDLIELGKRTAQVDQLTWSKGEGKKRAAYLCYSSGTSGLPKGVMISHRNIITNVLSLATMDGAYQNRKRSADGKPGYQENVLGLLPFSHIYGLVFITQTSFYMGDTVVVLPKFEMDTCLNAIQRFKINLLYIVPPILILFTRSASTLSRYDLSSIRTIVTGAAPLGQETAEDLQRMFPHWAIRQAYGLTETSTVVTNTVPDDIFFGSSGTLVPGYEAKVMTSDGKTEITEYDVPGELWAKSGSVVLGYLNNPKATAETFVDGFMKTGDEVVVRKSAKGHEHFFIVDRIKELIKVKGHQVAPAELEAHILTHPDVADCAVIPVPDDSAGELPKAFVVRNQTTAALESSDTLVKRAIIKHVERHKARHKWLKGGVEFIDVIPKSPSGKILRRLLRDKERERLAKAQGPRL